MSAPLFPSYVRNTLIVAGLFMPVFLILPFFFWGNEDGSIDLGEVYTQEVRLAPVGELVVGEPSVAATADAPAEFSTDATYTAVCAACHETGVAGAPIHDDTAAWQARLDAKGGLEGLYQSGLVGVAGTSMVAKGGSTITDEQFHEMVVYMLDNAGVAH